MEQEQTVARGPNDRAKHDGSTKVTHLACVVPLPNLAQLNKIEAAISNFLWDENKARLNRALSQQKIKKGGLGQINLTAKLKAIKTNWPAKLYHSEQKGPWKDAMYHIFKEHRYAQQNKHTLETKLTQTNKLPLFYKQFFKHWDELKQRGKDTIGKIEEILK